MHSVHKCSDQKLCPAAPSPVLNESDRVAHAPCAAVKAVCSEYRIHNADVYVRDESVTVDDLVDVIEGSRVYIPAIYVINKIDQARPAPARHLFGTLQEHCILCMAGQRRPRLLHQPLLSGLLLRAHDML